MSPAWTGDLLCGLCLGDRRKRIIPFTAKMSALWGSFVGWQKSLMMDRATWPSWDEQLFANTPALTSWSLHHGPNPAGHSHTASQKHCFSAMAQLLNWSTGISPTQMFFQDPLLFPDPKGNFPAGSLICLIIFAVDHICRLLKCTKGMWPDTFSMPCVLAEPSKQEL